MPTPMAVVQPGEAAGEVLECAAAPLITGKGEHDFACGRCGKLLLEHVFRAQVRDMVVRCPACGSVNRVPSVRPH